jgi:hypothetical protein
MRLPSPAAGEGFALGAGGWHFDFALRARHGSQGWLEPLRHFASEPDASRPRCAVILVGLFFHQLRA